VSPREREREREGERERERGRERVNAPPERERAREREREREGEGEGECGPVCLSSSWLLAVQMYLPSQGSQIVFFNRLDLYHTPPDSGERQRRSRTRKRRFDCFESELVGVAGRVGLLLVPRPPRRAAGVSTINLEP
jgi:hypothetical protein